MSAVDAMIYYVYEPEWCYYFEYSDYLIIAVLLVELAKNEAINLMENADLTEKSWTLQNIKLCDIEIQKKRKILSP